MTCRSRANRWDAVGNSDDQNGDNSTRHAGPLADMLVALALTTVGVACALRGIYLGIPLTDLNGPGTAPLAFGTVLAGTGAAATIRAWVKFRTYTRKVPTSGSMSHLRNPTTGLLLLIGYAVALEPLGFLPATLLFGLLTLRLLGWGWIKSMVSAVVLAGAVYAVFALLLGSPLPTSVLG